MATVDQGHQHLRKLIVDGISLVVKGSVDYQESYSIDGTIGLTIDNSTLVFIRVVDNVEKSDTKPIQTSAFSEIGVKHERVRALIVETVTLLIKSGAKYEEKCLVEGTICIKIDDTSMIHVALDEVVEMEDFSIVVDTEEDELEDEEEVKVEYDESPDVRRPLDISEIQPPSKGRRTMKGPLNKPVPQTELENNDEEDVVTIVLPPELLPQGDGDDDLIAVERDGSFWIEDLHYKPAIRSAGRYNIFYQGFKFLMNAGTAVKTHWRCSYSFSSCCKVYLHTQNLQRFGPRAPGKLLQISGVHNHTPEGRILGENVGTFDAPLTEDESDITIEDDGSFWIGDLHYAQAKHGRGYSLFYHGYQFAPNKFSNKQTEWLCSRRSRYSSKCLARVYTENMPRFGVRGPGRFLKTVNEHNHWLKSDGRNLRKDKRKGMAANSDGWAQECFASYATHRKKREKWSDTPTEAERIVRVADETQPQVLQVELAEGEELVVQEYGDEGTLVQEVMQTEDVVQGQEVMEGILQPTQVIQQQDDNKTIWILKDGVTQQL